MNATSSGCENSILKSPRSIYRTPEDVSIIQTASKITFKITEIIAFMIPWSAPIIAIINNQTHTYCKYWLHFRLGTAFNRIHKAFLLQITQSPVLSNTKWRYQRWEIKRQGEIMEDHHERQFFWTHSAPSSTHFCRLVTDSATTFPQSTFEGNTQWKTVLPAIQKQWFSARPSFHKGDWICLIFNNDPVFCRWKLCSFLTGSWPLVRKAMEAT